MQLNIFLIWSVFVLVKKCTLAFNLCASEPIEATIPFPYPLNPYRPDLGRRGKELT